MRLLDQTRANPFYVRMHGEQPVEDGIASPLPAEVEAPPDWAHASALLLVAEVSPTGHVLGNIVAPVAEPRSPAAMRGRWCVWRVDGSLVRALDAALDGERLVDAAWAGEDILELRWAAEDIDDYVLVAGDRRARFPLASASSVRMSAQSLGRLRAPTHWLVWLASGHGEGGMDVIELGASITRQFSLSPAHGEVYPGAIAISDDGVLVFAAYGSDGPQLVIVESSGTRTLPFAVAGNPDEWVMELTPESLIVRAGDRSATFARPLVGPFAI